MALPVENIQWINRLLSIMWQRGALGTNVWKRVICTGQCYRRNGEYVEEDTCIPRANKSVQATSFVIGNSGKWNCVP